VNEENPYQAQEAEEPPTPKKQVLAKGCKGAFGGCLLGGIVIPMILVLFCSLLIGDLGGFGFWILVGIGSAFVGTMIGFLLGCVTKPD
jgi:hypothetical protein